MSGTPRVFMFHLGRGKDVSPWQQTSRGLYSERCDVRDVVGGRDTWPSKTLG